MFRRSCVKKKFNQERSDRSPSEEKKKPRSRRVCAALMEFKHDRSRCSYLRVVADNYLLTTLGRQRRREIIQTTTTGRGPLAPAAPSYFSGAYLFNCQIRLRVSTSLWTEKRGGGAEKAKHCRLIIALVTCLPFLNAPNWEIKAPATTSIHGWEGAQPQTRSPTGWSDQTCPRCVRREVQPAVTWKLDDAVNHIRCWLLFSSRSRVWKDNLRGNLWFFFLLFVFVLGVWFLTFSCLDDDESIFSFWSFFTEIFVHIQSHRAEESSVYGS